MGVIAGDLVTLLRIVEASFYCTVTSATSIFQAFTPKIYKIYTIWDLR